MPDPFAPEGVLPNVLRWIDRPGQAVRNVLRGNIGAAGRQLTDFITEPIDAATPFLDLIPEATKREDYVSGSELVGIDDNAWYKTPVDIGVGLATDPLTYLSFGALPAAKAAGTAGGKYAMSVGVPFYSKLSTPVLTAEQAIDPLSLAMRGADTAISRGAKWVDESMDTGTAIGAPRTQAQDAYQGFKTTVRRAAGADDLTAPTRAKLSEGGAAAAAGSKFWATQVEEAAKGLTKEERIILGKAMQGVDYQAGKAIPLSSDYRANIAALVSDPAQAAKLTNYADTFTDISRRQWEEGVAKGIYSSGTGTPDYLQRQWYLPVDEAEQYAKAAGLPSAVEERVLETPQQVADFLNTKQGAALETDVVRLMAQRANQQGSMLGKSALAKSLGATGKDLGELQKSAMEQIQTLAPTMKPDEVAALTNAVQGMKPREGLYKTLAGLNSMVKGPMVYGIILPKMGSLVRNKLGMAWQALSEPGAREQVLPQLKATIGDIGKAFDEAYGEVLFGTGKKMARSDEIGKMVTAIEDAMKAGRNTDDALQILAKTSPDAAEAMRAGVLDGFVSTEELVNRLGRNPGAQKWKDIRDAPGVMFQTLEQRGRLQMFLNLKRSGLPASEASRITKNALYDYGISSPENRALRDVIPFGQFIAKSIPQQAKLLSERPAAAVGLAPLFYDTSGEEGPVYPYMQGRSRLSVGDDATGTPLYLTGFGLPVESLDVLPNLSASPREAGRDVAQGMLSSTQPILKTVGAWATGKDPYFGTAFGSYDKIPLVGNAGDIGRAYNVAAGTGLLEPIGGGILRQLGQATDEKKPLGARAADLLTGAKLVSVDPDVAEQRVLTDYLEARPDVQQFRTFYQQEPDEEFGQIMSALRDAKARAKAKREAAAAAGL